MAKDSSQRPDRGADGRVTVSSWEDLQREVKPIVQRINEDQSLALAAAANPLFALEELGYDIDPEARQEIEDRLRFRPRDAKRLGQLRRELQRQAGGPFNPASDTDVRRLLAQVGVKVGRLRAARERPPLFAAEDAEPEQPDDPFARLRGKHALIEPLLEYRQLEAAEPRLATRDIYAALREGKRSVPITHLRAVIKPDRER